MKKFLWVWVCLGVLPLAAEVNIMTVTDEDKHTKKEDFFHTFEYFVTADSQPGSRCQATRIAPHWFATAAHCVKDLCVKNCTIRMDLLEAPVSVWAETVHTSKKPNVFVHPGYRPKQIVKDDFALIRLDLNTAPKIYYRRATAKNPAPVMLREKEFFAWLARNPRVRSMYHRVLRPQLPTLAVFDNGNYELDRKISVISIFDGNRQIKKDPYPVYHVKDLGYAYTQNFGIRKGMSGSGVMTNTGELVGIIAAYVGADLYKGKQKIKHKELFMFPVFNESLVQFMRDVMGRDFNRIEQKDAYPYLVRKTRRDFSEVKYIMKVSK